MWTMLEKYKEKHGGVAVSMGEKLIVNQTEEFCSGLVEICIEDLKKPQIIRRSNKMSIQSH